MPAHVNEVAYYLLLTTILCSYDYSSYQIMIVPFRTPAKFAQLEVKKTDFAQKTPNPRQPRKEKLKEKGNSGESEKVKLVHKPVFCIPVFSQGKKKS